MRSTLSLVPIALALGHPVPVLAADEIEVTFRYAARPSGGGVDALGPPTGAIYFDEGTDFEIEVPADFVDSVTGLLNTVRVIQIRAANPQTQSIGHITLSGTRAEFETLRVLIASNTIADFRDSALAPMPAGCLHWAGIHSEGDPGQGNYLPLVVTVAAGVLGNITGDSGDEIDVGQVYRLQADQTGSGVGQINLAITASTQSDGLPMYRSTSPSLDGALCIGEIWAGNQLTGTVTATGAADGGYDIGSIVAGQAGSSPGISGRIFAKGGIGTIETTGNITTPWTTTTPGIQATGGIAGITVGESGQSGTRVLDTFVKSGATSTGGFIGTIEVFGDLEDPIECINLGLEVDGGGALDQSGIIVTGTIRAPITISNRLAWSCIKAADIDADIVIGHSLQGQIHATQGDIDSLTIGYDTTLPNHGVWGVNNAPGTPARNRRCIIAADTIDHLDISQVYAYGENTPPSIYADEVTILNIGPMFWGEIKEDPDGLHSDHYPYVLLNEADIAETFTYVICIGGNVDCQLEHAAIWCEDFERFDIAGDHGGEVRFSHLTADRTFRVGGDLYNIFQPGFPTPQPYPGNDHNAVSVDEEVSTEGQIIINANGVANPNLGLHGYSVCELALDESTLPLRYGTLPGPATLPEYETPSVDVGGGAVGIAPFYLYDVDCRPVNNAVGEHALLQSQFENFANDSVPTAPIVPAWYGGARTNLTSGSPVNIYLILVLNSQTVLQLIPESNYTVACKRGTDPGMSRFISIVGSGRHDWAAGRYRVESKAVGSGGLFCDGVEGGPALAVEPYFFTLRLDCDHDGIEDEQGDCIICGVGDFNQDGGVDGGDVEAFFTAWENAVPAADVNQDGGIDGGDVQTFFLAWEAGC